MGNNESRAGGQAAVSAKETYVWYRKFMREYPSGLQTLHEFKTLLGLQGLNPKANQHVDQVYNTFDMNKDGFIDFLEFIAAINLVIRGKMDQKLKWYFKLYDADGNGSIDKKELLNIFMAVQALNGQQTLSPEEFTNLVFNKIDINNDGELTLEEFINGTEKDQDLLDIVSKSFDFSNVLKVIYSGKQPDTEGRLPSNHVRRLI
ncbi:guanylyl cyclase-activating protein 3 isoform 1-T1 [Lycaon pictus]|uniref:guanylyl cyclase-activating protein 3 n=1 Tax=Canis lupus dingo TaxID=286419 RepID=UPI00004A7252|nr:guanylyl cyclase-activating protein 3 [Canis lupus dingo]XP_038300812.1 guanylyl cyclase-activating protein 3 [Canis lupus familiaris]XP_038438681.1 guanylyl cyclase-activating protein 3 [Canis lupus familiaris]XP_545090.4 guanylyl cyclase-activating protein 3 [Canis lupus familiaris]|eukprot:XP_545090.4 guanylyl cyclase-activating protein 3 [Canis lupus familiaris]